MRWLKTGRHWWWVFVVCIAVPALALAIFGLRTVDLERIERRAQLERQQAQTELLAEARIMDSTRKLDRDLAPGGMPFTLDSSGTLVFPRERIYFAEAGEEPSGARVLLSEAQNTAAELALAAEAQGDFPKVRELCRGLARDPQFGVWARFVPARMELGQRPQEFIEWTREFTDQSARRAVSPDGEPVMLLGAALVRRLPANYAAECRAFVSTALAELRGGRWWLRYQARKLWDAELRQISEAAGHDRTPEDALLAHAARIQRALRGMASTSSEGPTVLYHSEDTARYLIVATAQSTSPVTWNGMALPAEPLADLLQKSMMPIRNTFPYPVALTDSSGHLLWGDVQATGAARSFHLRAVSGWELRLGQPPGGDRSRFLWYAFVAILLIMLAFGVAVTLRAARHEMELARMQAEFAAGVTHEFKSPITGIRLLMERIIGGRIHNRSTMQDYYMAVCRETNRLELLVNRLLETHRIQSGRVHYHFAPHAIRDLVESAIARLQTEADTKHIALILEANDGSREVEMDRTAMQDSIENLIENAIKYSPPDTQVQVVVEYTAKELRITVKDQGAGIEADDLPHIFDRFYRGRRDDRQAVRGTGLGLPLVKAVAEGHGGSIDVKSAPGKGSEFCLRIPIREEENYAQSLDRG